MGGDISVFEEDQLENDLDILCKNESLVDLFNRSLSEMTEVLTQPKRFEYTSSHLRSDKNECSNYNLEEFDFHCSDGVSLHCAKWSRVEPSNVLVIYTHTNRRAIVDANEVLPFCNIIQGNLMAYDSRGCGKSTGKLSLLGSQDLSAVIKATVQANPDVQIVLWSRGISTHCTIELLSSLSASMSQNLKFVVLDSPFTSLEEVVSTAASNIKTLGIIVPGVFVKFALQMVKRNVTEQVGCDPYAIKPLLLAPRVRVPCFVVAADEDEYTPLEMGERMCAAWGGECFFREFPGSHFTERDECLVMTPAEKALKCLGQQQEQSEGDDDGDGTWSLVTPLDTRSGSDSEIAPVSPVSPSSVSSDNLPWTPDGAASSCLLCAESFTLTRRKHHCRKCGGVVCAACSPHRLVIARSSGNEKGPQAPVRVCDACNNLHFLSL